MTTGETVGALLAFGGVLVTALIALAGAVASRREVTELERRMAVIEAKQDTLQGTIQHTALDVVKALTLLQKGP
jgi:type II secretory pathway pseudopilin PulG